MHEEGAATDTGPDKRCASEVSHDSGNGATPSHDQPPTKRPLRRSSRQRRPDAAHYNVSLRGRYTQLFYSDQPEELSFGRCRLQKLHAKPNIYRVDNFLSESELECLGRIVATKRDRFKRSFTSGRPDEQHISEQRTSTFMWIAKGHSSTIRNIERRAADMIAFPHENVEPLQVVSYRDGQRFNAHHDSGTIPDDVTLNLEDRLFSSADDSTDSADAAGGDHQRLPDVDVVAPVRAATFFVYLNTLPAGQGATAFPLLSPPLKAQPRRGTAVLFPNLRPDGSPEPLTVHCACPVSDSYRKFGMNVWIAMSSMQMLAGVQPGPRGGGSTRRVPDDPQRSFVADHFSPKALDVSLGLASCRQCHQPLNAGTVTNTTKPHQPDPSPAVSDSNHANNAAAGERCVACGFWFCSRCRGASCDRSRHTAMGFHCSGCRSHACGTASSSTQ